MTENSISAVDYYKETPHKHSSSEGANSYFSASKRSTSFSLPRSNIEGIKMYSGELLSVEPQELQFPFELKKQISCAMQLNNMTDNHVAFKVKTTNPKKYCVKPNTGVVLPRSSCNVIVTMQAQKDFPPDMQCKDKFLLQSVVGSPGVTSKDATPEMFNKESGKHVEECKLRVVYVSPLRPPSPVQEESEEGASSPRASFSENAAMDTSEFSSTSRPHVQHQDSSTEVRDVISLLTEERNSAIQLNTKLQRDLDLLRRQASKSNVGIPFVYVIIIGLIGILLGYLIKKA